MPRPPKKTSPFDKHLGRVVRSKRTKAGLSQAEVAERAGIPLSNYQRRESGANEITASEIERIARAVGVPAAELVAEALKDYGGIDKLIDEHIGVSDVPISLDDHRKRRTPADMTEEEWEGQRSAANTDPEIGLDEPEQP